MPPGNPLVESERPIIDRYYDPNISYDGDEVISEPIQLDNDNVSTLIAWPNNNCTHDYKLSFNEEQHGLINPYATHLNNPASLLHENSDYLSSDTNVHTSLPQHNIKEHDIFSHSLTVNQADHIPTYFLNSKKHYR